MLKVSMMRFFALVVVVFCVGSHVSADVQLQGPGVKRIVFGKDTLDYKMDYSKAHEFYIPFDIKQEQYYTLRIGECKVEFKVRYSRFKEDNYRSHTSYIVREDWDFLQYTFPFGTVKSSSINFHSNYYTSYVKDYPCNANFDSSLVPGKYIVDVSLSGDVAPDLIVNFPDAELFATWMIPKQNCTRIFEDLEVREVVLLIGFVFVLLLTIGLSFTIVCCYYRMKKATTQKVVESKHSTVTKSTKSSAPKHSIKKTSLHEADLIYFGRDATPVDLNTKSQKANSTQTPQ